MKKLPLKRTTTTKKNQIQIQRKNPPPQRKRTRKSWRSGEIRRTKSAIASPRSPRGFKRKTNTYRRESFTRRRRKKLCEAFLEKEETRRRRAVPATGRRRRWCRLLSGITAATKGTRNGWMRGWMRVRCGR